MADWYRQFDLRSGEHHLTCWLEDDTRLRPGVRLTLKGDTHARLWTIVSVSSTRLSSPPETRWQVCGGERPAADAGAGQEQVRHIRLERDPVEREGAACEARECGQPAVATPLNIQPFCAFSSLI
jgi:hypothetical protein